MAIKIYRKQGKLDYKEKRLVNQIQEALTKKFQENPALESSFTPATTKDQLQQLHNIYCAEEVQFAEIKQNPKQQTESQTPSENMEKNNPPKSEQSASAPETESNQDDFVDPFNREEPMVRDYVMDEGLKKTDVGNQNTAQPQNNFTEPVTFDDSFRLPDDEPTSQTPPKSSQNQNQGQSQTTQVKAPKSQSTPSEDSRSLKRRKRFAKNVITAVCALLERGFVWYGTRKINDIALAEYELNGELDKDSLSTLINLTDGQEATVREFFQQQCMQVKKESKITKEQKDDLIDTFHDVLLEKNMVPTPMQDFLMAWGEVVANQGLAVIISSAQTGSILDQLKDMKKNTENADHTEVREEAKAPEPAPAAPAEQQQAEPSKSEEELNAAMSESTAVTANEHEIGETTNTKE
jgi:hypothetical protein